jgi:hypothetical protein
VEDDVEDDQYADLADRYGDDDEPEETQDYRRIG